MKINNNLEDPEDPQKVVIKGIAFGGLLEVKCPHVPEDLSHWLELILLGMSCVDTIIMEAHD
jgi:hypothetical protein